MLYTALVIILVLISVVLIGLIMLQQGKGADAGAAFGTGVSGTMFGSRGGGNMLSHITAGLATAFFVVTLALAYMANHQHKVSHSVVDRVQAAQQSSQSGSAAAGAVPAAPASSQQAAPVQMQTGAPEAPASANATAGAISTHGTAETKPSSAASATTKTGG